MYVLSTKKVYSTYLMLDALAKSSSQINIGELESLEVPVAGLVTLWLL
jgi:hypothetical protein